MKTKIYTKEDLPNIITANTYFWHPSSARWRRSNEDKRLTEVENFLKKFFTEVKRNGDEITAKNEKISVRFYYSESARHVYKKFQVWDSQGNKKDIRFFLKYINGEI